MKVTEEDKSIELTRRNLLTLLAKLDGHPPNSYCTIIGDGWLVRAVEDEKHYGNRPPGQMHPSTEEVL